MKIIYPPRPKGRMQPADLAHYEASGSWLAQRKFRGSRAVLYISKDRDLTIGSRHGRIFSSYSLDQELKSQILGGLRLEDGKAYWLDGELMNKDKGSTMEYVLFDILQAGRYLFGFPDQSTRLDTLHDLCGRPVKMCRTGMALEVGSRLWLAETFTSDFQARFEEARHVEQIEGLVLRKRSASLDHFGDREYETNSLIRCRKEDKSYQF